MAYIGDTIKICCTFKAFNGNYADPIDIKFSVYDLAKTKIGNTIVLTDENKIEVGIYEIIYTIPNELELLVDIKSEYLVIEIEGVLENTIVVSRKKLPINWAT